VGWVIIGPVTRHTDVSPGDVRRALELTPFDYERAWRRMAPRPYRKRLVDGVRLREAGVMCLLFPQGDGLAFFLTRRTENVATHKGQISLPGGALEQRDATPVDAALRETCEELAICRDDVQVLGTLTPLDTVTGGFRVTPVVGYLPARPQVAVNPAEVAEVIEMPLVALLDDSIKVEERWEWRGMPLDVPFYKVDEHIVWGVTATILSELEARLLAVLDHPLTG
jgi:8-oxo-dGTP pyrophosphatase MutT (NUDIX family)